MEKPAVVTAATPPQHRDGLLIHFQALLEIVVVATFIAAFIVQPFRIPSESMQPTLLVGDFLLGNKQSFAPSGFLDHLLPPTTIHRGDLILFHYPVDPNLHLVKRVIGLPGDHIRLHNNQVILNGAALAEPYAHYNPAPPDDFRDNFPTLRSADPNVDPRWWAQLRHLATRNGLEANEITVPPNQYFVLGDNRNSSLDSRYWGFVPREAIVGRPLLVYFSVANPTPAPTTKQTLLTRLQSLLGHPRILH